MSTHHGFLKEFPFIRVDAFDGNPVDVNPYSDDAPHLYLLTHAHTDHFVGLNSPDFEGEIYCTAVTKHILLHTMEAGDRVRVEELPHMKSGNKRKFANLWSKRRSSKPGKDRIDAHIWFISALWRQKEIQLNAPTRIEGPQGTAVVITALDANHCPGSCMFLIEGIINSERRAILITGDIRAEPWWVESLSRNPLVQKYLSKPGEGSDRKGKRRARGLDEEKDDLWPSLDCIYLDTSMVGMEEELVSKASDVVGFFAEAVEGMVKFMREYPESHRFFLNSWTWGYEDMLKGVAKTFNTKVHLDFYKQMMYSDVCQIGVDPLLSEIGTQSTAPLRFHACERRWKCDQVWADGVGCYEFAEEYLECLEGKKRFKRPGSGEGDGGEVVYVNPSAMSRRAWEVYKAKLEQRMERIRRVESGAVGRSESPRGLDDEDRLPNYLIVPLSRHSSLPELQDFVSLFRPKTIYPLVMEEISQTPCTDYINLSITFRDCLGPNGSDRLLREAKDHQARVMRSRRKRKMIEPLSASVQDMGGEEAAGYFAGIHGSERSGEKVPTCLLNIEGGAEIEELRRKVEMEEEDVLVQKLKPDLSRKVEKVEMEVVVIEDTPSPPSF
ncbi:DNA cross-link repair 1C protein [Pseudohyphozyma bogoriensis]|nr:DNA cross-link repair 1C protein [Pseudohyphozyma bogoriensis]